MYKVLYLHSLFLLPISYFSFRTMPGLTSFTF